MSPASSPLRQSTVTVLVATYNRARYLRESLDSLLGQTMRPHQLIVVDDGSDDATPEIVASYGDAIMYLRKPNGGRASATNHAEPHIAGEWLWLFDDDDVALPDSLERRFLALCQHGTAELAFSGHYVGEDDAQGQLQIRHEVRGRAGPLGNLLLDEMLNHHLLLPGALMRTALFRAAGPWNERYLRSSDYEFTVRLLRLARDVVIVAEPTFVWREHPGLRGPGNSRHASTQREAVWMRFDAMLGRQIRQELNLLEYLGREERARELTAARRQQALLNRMAVMASKGLVVEMLEDVEAFAALRDATKRVSHLSVEQALECQRAVLRPYFLLALLKNPRRFTEGLRLVVERYDVRDLIACFAKGLLYAARRADRPWQARIRLFACALVVAAIAGTRQLRTAYAQR
jgi:glycosyltransferase involved in cell wall biosynthesis